MSEKIDKRSNQSGFSLIEVLVTMAVFSFIMYGVYLMIVHYGQATKTEQSRMRLQQENRFISSVFSEELKDAGSVLTLSHTGGFLAAAPYFNGVFPLNNQHFPDGVIIASGDPDAVTKLASDHTSGGTVLNVTNALVDGSVTDPYEYPPWSTGDLGIVISPQGYYVFEVESADITNNTISTRAWDEPVYYSGQLLTDNYYDLGSGSAGNAITYPKNSPVVRLANFAIYIFKEVTESRTNRKLRQLLRVSDTHGVQDVIKNPGAEVSIISENIWDLQISYMAYDNFETANRTSTPDRRYFFNQSSPSDVNALITDLRSLKVKQIDMTVVTLTDLYGGKGETQATLPTVGDRYSPDTLPTGKYGLKISTYSVEPRNFNIILVPKT